jgi:hypothetical protein
MVCSPRHRGVCALAGRRARPGDPRIDPRWIDRRGFVGRSEDRLFGEFGQLVAGVVFRAAVAAYHRVALVETFEPFGDLSSALRLRSLPVFNGCGLPEAKGYVAQKKTDTIDYRDAESLRVR